MDLKKTANLISNARKEKGITQKELAEKLHISDRTVSKWERGAGFPDVSILTELADILGFTVTELLQGELMPESDCDLGSDLTIREAVNALYQQTAAKAKKNRQRFLSAALIFILIAGGAGFGLKKLGEEATEIVIAAKNPNPNEIKYEISDFLYHMMVLMAEKGITWEEIIEDLAKR